MLRRWWGRGPRRCVDKERMAANWQTGSAEVVEEAPGEACGTQGGGPVGEDRGYFVAERRIEVGGEATSEAGGERLVRMWPG